MAADTVTKRKPSVSVALATYNGAAFLEEQLDSILAQTYPLLEIVIFDDRSTDDTPKILSRYRDTFPDLIKIEYNTTNIGYIKNFEKAVAACRGDLIALSDQDDIWDADKIELLALALGDNDLVHSDARLIDDKNVVISASYSAYAAKRTGDDRFLKLCFNNTVTGCTALFTRSLKEKALPFPPSTSHDHWLALAAKDGAGIAYYPHPTISYRQHGGNVQGAKSVEASKVIERKKERSLRALVRDREKANLKGRAKFEGLAAAAEGRISQRHWKIIKKAESYYASYFSKRVRFGAFFFHLFHYRVLSEKKSPAQGLYGLAMSLFGIGKGI